MRSWASFPMFDHLADVMVVGHAVKLGIGFAMKVAPVPGVGEHVDEVAAVLVLIAVAAEGFAESARPLVVKIDHDRFPSVRRAAGAARRLELVVFVFDDAKREPA